MNIFLVPYTWFRHFAVAINVAGAAVLTWWVALLIVVGIGPTMSRAGIYWSQAFEGTMLMACLAGVIAFTSVLAEGSLRRRKMFFRMFFSGMAGAISFGTTLGAYLVFRMLVPYMSTARYQDVVNDSSLVTLRYTLAVWALAGVMSGLGPFIARKAQRVWSRTTGWGMDGVVAPKATMWWQRFADLFFHTGGGFAAAITGAGVWHYFGQYDQVAGDLYLGPAVAAFTWGFLHGLLTWGIPPDMYAGWIRILSAERYGLRIPVDRVDGAPAERFLGHFPRGLDMYMPAQHGVAELHTSFVVDDDHNYAVRGLSIQPTVVRRFLERLNLRYDTRRPAPLETKLQMGDRVLLGAKDVYSEVEFVMLPKEEM